MIVRLFKNIGKVRLVRAFLFVCILASCTNSASYRADRILDGAADRGYSARTLSSPPFSLLLAEPDYKSPSRVLHIVIEGDGLAWANRYTVSDNPTPKRAVGLEIASKQGALYLARPCQYIWQDQCTPRYWAQDRFAPDVIASYQSALDLLKYEHGAQAIKLSGFSGGAYVAFVLSATRDDVIAVDTYAGVLDPQWWTAHHEVSPLNVTHSLPELLQNSQNATFRHFCAERDTVVPCALARDVLNAAQGMGFRNHTVRTIYGAKHLKIADKI